MFQECSKVWSETVLLKNVTCRSSTKLYHNIIHVKRIQGILLNIKNNRKNIWTPDYNVGVN